MSNQESSFKRNAVANYIGVGYVNIAGIISLPLYLKYLGPEAYGLVGFYTVIHSWLILLDLGMSATLSREIAKCTGELESAFRGVRQLIRSIELLFLLVSITVALLVWSLSPWVTANWLNIGDLLTRDVQNCVSLMGVIFILRWFSSLYRSGLAGLEKFVWLNAIEILVASLRYLGALAFLAVVSNNPVNFFLYQLCVSLIELLVFGGGFYWYLPSIYKAGLKINIESIKRVLPLSLSLAYTSIIWICLTQLDKIILSNTLSLKEFGYFTLVIIVSNGVLSLASPVGRALMPKMASLLSQGKESEMLDLYEVSTRFIAGFIITITGLISLFSQEILFALTGDATAADWAGAVLAPYILGTGILTLSAFQYYLQFAHGNLKLHVLNSSINALVQVPVFIYSAINFGVMGVAFSWLLIRMAAFLIWPTLVHMKFAPGLHLRWLLNDIAQPLLIALAMLAVTYIFKIILLPSNRLEILSFLLVSGALMLVIQLLSASYGKKYVFSWFRLKA